MALKYEFGKQITIILEKLDLENRIAVIEKDPEKKERKIFQDEMGCLAIRDQSNRQIDIVPTDFKRAGYDPDSYEKWCYIIGHSK